MVTSKSTAVIKVRRILLLVLMMLAAIVIPARSFSQESPAEDSEDCEKSFQTVLKAVQEKNASEALANFSPNGCKEVLANHAQPLGAATAKWLLTTNTSELAKQQEIYQDVVSLLEAYKERLSPNGVDVEHGYPNSFDHLATATLTLLQVEPFQDVAMEGLKAKSGSFSALDGLIAQLQESPTEGGGEDLQNPDEEEDPPDDSGGQDSAEDEEEDSSDDSSGQDPAEEGKVLPGWFEILWLGTFLLLVTTGLVVLKIRREVHSFGSAMRLQGSDFSKANFQLQGLGADVEEIERRLRPIEEFAAKASSIVSPAALALDEEQVEQPAESETAPESSLVSTAEQGDSQSAGATERTTNQERDAPSGSVYEEREHTERPHSETTVLEESVLTKSLDRERIVLRGLWSNFLERAQRLYGVESFNWKEALESLPFATFYAVVDRLPQVLPPTSEARSSLVRMQRLMEGMLKLQQIPDVVKKEERGGFDERLLEYRELANFLAILESTDLGQEILLFDPRHWLRNGFLPIAEEVLRSNGARAGAAGLSGARQLVAEALKVGGLKPMSIERRRTLFDNRLHDAASQAREPGVPDGVIVDIVQYGFLSADSTPDNPKIHRRAVVVVNRV